jgi:hypothetical protein
MPRTVLQTVMLTATPQYVNWGDWSRLQAGGALHVVGCWHPDTAEGALMLVAATRTAITQAGHPDSRPESSRRH